jgi:hypothetical protein
MVFHVSNARRQKRPAINATDLSSHPIVFEAASLLECSEQFIGIE